MEVLKGVTIIDFTQAYSGPYCTMQLADFGARVIKIEKVNQGDQSREWTPIHKGASGYFAAINRNKEGVSIDLTQPEGVEIARKLISNADILVENYKVGSLDLLGLGYEDVKKINPTIIYASLSGFGQTGPLRNLLAYDNIVQSMSGIMEMTGFPKDLPTRLGPAVGDNFTGLNMSLAIMMAYYHKLNTGQGQRVDLAMLDTVFNMMESPILFHSLLGKKTTRVGNSDSGTLVPYDVFKCKDGYFSVGLASDAGWGRFCETIQMPELIGDPRFISNEIRCENYEVITPIISKFFDNKARDQLLELFTNAGIPCAPVLEISEIMTHEQILERSMVVQMVDSGIGEYSAIGNPMHLSKTPANLKKGSPLLGEDTEKILREYGYSLEEIQTFKEKAVI